MLGRIADHLLALRSGHPLRVAVEGGPTRSTLAIHLCSALAARGVTAVYVAAADFPDLDALTTEVLVPLGPGGSLRHRERDGGPVLKAEPDSVVVVDGAGGRPVVSALWDDVLLVRTDDHADDGADNGADDGADDGRAGCVIGNDDPDHPVLERIGGRPGTRIMLFSYGTLQLPAVQQANFGRLLLGATDGLPGYESHVVTIGDPDVVAASGSNQHPVVKPSRDEASTVAGTALLIHPEDLAAADLYEVDDYRRILVRLASGIEAWTYVASTPAP